MDAIDISALRADILRWYDARMRELPWRGSHDPYAIWVSEIMLQQTRAEAVIKYFLAFMRDYPDVHRLAAAGQSEVLKHWEGLGYYSRARNLHKAAKMVAGPMGGALPRDAAGLRVLPGIGEYTAGMIASIAYGLPEPAIDGNQVRVLSRIFLVDEPAREKRGAQRIREGALALLSEDRPGDFNQALMDLGAQVCRPRRADCGVCPARRHCLAHAEGAPERLPILPAKADKRLERRGAAVVLSGERVLVYRQPEPGLLGGLWMFPNFLNAVSAAQMRACLLELGVDARQIQKLESVRHVFTHLIWEQTGRLFRARAETEVPGMRWADAQELMALAMPVAHAPYREAALRLMGGEMP